ncbi:MAG: hypothetical protein RL291_1193, partial [Pseudomonadota bacterium]
CSKLLISVADTGIGISREIQARLFQPFSQADSSINRRFGGTGLGLAISLHLIKLMDGVLQLQSEPGNGTTIIIELPFDTAPQLSSEPKDTNTLDGKRILVVDDRETNREILLAYLSGAGAATSGAASASDAMASLTEALREKQPFDLIVIDVVMPDIDGVELAQTLRRAPAFKNLPIVMVSSLSWKGDQRSTRALGVQEFLTKPVRRTDLARAAIRAIDPMKSLVEPAAPTQPFAQATTRLDGHVLVAEDNAVNVEVAIEYIMSLGLSFEIANDGQEAVEAYKSRRFDLVLMDCQMPGIDGLSATRIIRDFETLNGRKRAPIVAVTAHAFEQDRIACLDAGMDDYISKPFTEEALVAVLKKWLPPAPIEAALVMADETSPLDPSVIEDLTQRKPQLFKRLVAIYTGHSPVVVDQLAEAAALANVAALRAAAHSLKSSSAQVGATKLSDLCRQAETRTTDETTESLVELARRISDEHRGVLRALEREKRRLAG